jgi:hypothetical protein
MQAASPSSRQGDRQATVVESPDGRRPPESSYVRAPLWARSPQHTAQPWSRGDCDHPRASARLGTWGHPRCPCFRGSGVSVEPYRCDVRQDRHGRVARAQPNPQLRHTPTTGNTAARTVSSGYSSAASARRKRDALLAADAAQVTDQLALDTVLGPRADAVMGRRRVRWGSSAGTCAAAQSMKIASGASSPTRRAISWLRSSRQAAASARSSAFRRSLHASRSARVRAFTSCGPVADRRIVSWTRGTGWRRGGIGLSLLASRR